MPSAVFPRPFSTPSSPIQRSTLSVSRPTLIWVSHPLRTVTLAPAHLLSMDCSRPFSIDLVLLLLNSGISFSTKSSFRLAVLLIFSPSSHFPTVQARPSLLQYQLPPPTTHLHTPIRPRRRSLLGEEGSNLSHSMRTRLEPSLSMQSSKRWQARTTLSLDSKCMGVLRTHPSCRMV